jgi:hypothetical protein
MALRFGACRRQVANRRSKRLSAAPAAQDFGLQTCKYIAIGG